ncbi:hypothetical protein MAPG_06025 [Magnaporthiopsis poae ATCC 64411]|uniref:Uncharacterized protein n=1 Tax=Magnaporthiopsis poae (strain ATCC 64411 / 73-15) TaxID=644358 RepID=A0A0C4E0Y3_MAGP6|nr:hypothetical protein MAPG_06025 [Magnaporthiopsis poae ATCC 64411]
MRLFCYLPAATVACLANGKRSRSVRDPCPGAAAVIWGRASASCCCGAPWRHGILDAVMLLASRGSRDCFHSPDFPNPIVLARLVALLGGLLLSRSCGGLLIFLGSSFG